VRGLAARLGAQRVFCALAAALEQEADLHFAATLVQALNLLLLTVPEVCRRGQAFPCPGDTTQYGICVLLASQPVSGTCEGHSCTREHSTSPSCCWVRQAAELRGLLQRALQSAEGGRLFAALYRSWAHSAGATLSLCLLARAYEHAAAVVAAFADIPVTVEVLMQVPPLPPATAVAPHDTLPLPRLCIEVTAFLVGNVVHAVILVARCQGICKMATSCEWSG
jgi:vacuole morphology and inheritance protein 14